MSPGPTVSVPTATEFQVCVTAPAFVMLLQEIPTRDLTLALDPQAIFPASPLHFKEKGEVKYRGQDHTARIRELGEAGPGRLLADWFCLLFL